MIFRLCLSPQSPNSASSLYSYYPIKSKKLQSKCASGPVSAPDALLYMPLGARKQIFPFLSTYYCIFFHCYHFANTAPSKQKITSRIGKTCPISTFSFIGTFIIRADLYNFYYVNNMYFMLISNVFQTYSFIFCSQKSIFSNSKSIFPLSSTPYRCYNTHTFRQLCKA